LRPPQHLLGCAIWLATTSNRQSDSLSRVETAQLQRNDGRPLHRGESSVQGIMTAPATPQLPVNASPNERKLTIDVISDVVCPWCFIGRRRLGVALSSLAQHRADVVPTVSWHPFQLNPDLPREGMDRRAYLEAKFGGAERIELVRERIGTIGDAVGIEFAFDRIGVQPNTLDAHRLVSWAQALGNAEDVVERLFRAFFLEGRNVGDRSLSPPSPAKQGSITKPPARCSNRRMVRRKSRPWTDVYGIGSRRRAVCHLRWKGRGRRRSGAGIAPRCDAAVAGRRSGLIGLNVGAAHAGDDLALGRFGRR
jgi:2-hydroxychromene-2-carboxylate isomerase